MKRILYFFLGLTGLAALLCSVAAAGVTNGNLMLQGFSQYSRTAHLNVSPARYGEYAREIARYLDGKADAVRVNDPDSGETKPAFSERENAHLTDVRGIVTALKLIRWIGGGLTLAALALLYARYRADRAAFLAGALRGFAGAAIFLLALAAALAIWGAVNFDGLFVTFHKVVFANDLWLLNPQTDLLMALMPLPFFSWYAGEMLKSLLPILGLMIVFIIAYIKTKERAK
jgi:integral membrane protein (TIGR01906 family)